MIDHTHPPVFTSTQRPPFSVLQADARFRRAETMPPVRLQRVVERVVDAIEYRRTRRMRAFARLMSRRAERARLAEGAELAAWEPFLAVADDS